MMGRYQLSGAVPLSGLLVALLCGLATALAGIVYAFGYNWIPIAHVRVLATLGLGFMIGHVVAGRVKPGHLRSRFVPALIGFCSGSIALALAWMFDAVAKFGWEDVRVLTTPALMKEYAGYLYDNGAWSLHDDKPVKGAFLSIVWILEGLVIVGLSTALPWNAVNGLVYCEQCGEWCEIDSGVRLLSPANAAAIAESANRGDLAPLLAADASRPEDAEFLRVSLVYCPTCDNSHYLTVRHIAPKIDSQGNVTEAATSIVDGMPLMSDDAVNIREWAASGSDGSGIP